MANIKRRQATLTSGGWQAYEGAGVLMGAVIDYAAASSGCVLTAYNGTSTSGIQVFTRSSDTDAGTTVPIGLYTNGDLVAGTSTDNVKSGIPFATGLFINKTGDTTHTVDITLFIKPLIKKSSQVTTSGSAGSASGGATVFSGPGLLHAVGIRSDIISAVSTADITVKDSPIVGSGNTIWTKTNYGYAADAIRPVVTTTNADEGGTAVTTAATGAYASPGILFTTGLNFNVAQANAGDVTYAFSFLIEA